MVAPSGPTKLRPFTSNISDLRLFHIRRVNLRSFILLSMRLISFAWSILSKHFSMSPSISHTADWNFWLTYLSAEWHPLSGRQPWDCSMKQGSYMAFRMMRIASCTIVSLWGPFGTIGIILPDWFGINVRRAVRNWNDSSLSLLASSWIASLDILSNVSFTIPGVRWLGWLLILSYASFRSSVLVSRL